MMYDYTVMHVLRQEADLRQINAEIIATVHGGYAPMKQKRMRRWLMERVSMLRRQPMPPVRIDPQISFGPAEIDTANMAGD